MNTSKGETSQDSKYLKPWYETGDNKAFFENELAKEINSNHPLFNKAVEAIAYSRMQDDVLFKINDDTFEYAVVHLTYSKTVEKSPKYPATKFYKNWQNVYDECIAVDHKEWSE
jgi:hypothetical protein